MLKISLIYSSRVNGSRLEFTIQNFQGMIFKRIQTYTMIFKSALFHLQRYSHAN